MDLSTIREDPRTAPPMPDWQRSAVFLDFDGTLAPLEERPENVRISEEMAGLVARLVSSTDGAVAVLSGRALDDLAARLGGVSVALSGSHGLEVLRPGEPRPDTDPVTESPGLSGAFGDLDAFARGFGLLIERKPGAVALHYRSDPDHAAACMAAVEAAAATHRLRVMHGKMVSEAALPGVDKGAALHGFLAQPPFAGRVPVMIGDDVTDEDGFRAAQALGGFGIKIGPGPTEAMYRLGAPADLADWLHASLGRAG